MKIALLSQSNVSDKTQTIRVEEIEQTSPDIYVEMTQCINSIDQQGNISNLLNKYKKDNSDNTNSEEYKRVSEEEMRFKKITKNDPESKAIGGKKRKRRKTKTHRAR
jgi:hypothetical protein